jgi:3-dehydroquinate dehydratase II
MSLLAMAPCTGVHLPSASAFSHGEQRMRILILNGPNLDRLGTREPSIYGTRTFDDYLSELRTVFADHVIELMQSNVEGELINIMHDAEASFDGVVMNAAGYTHTSVALRDTIAGSKLPVVEVHISNIHAREEFRERSLTAAKCVGTISGFGLDGYRMAIDHLVRKAR